VATFGPSIGSALVIAVVFARRPAEGIGAFLLVDLVAITLAHWFGISYRVLDEAAVVILAFVVILQKPTILSRRPGWKEAAVLVLVLAGLASSLVNAVPSDTWIPALLLLLKGIALYYAVRTVDLDIRDVERVGAVILGVAAVILLLGFVEVVNPAAFQSAVGLPPYDAERTEGIPVAKSIFLHPALYGWLTAFVSLFLYARFAVIRSWWALGLALVFNVGTILSFRRRLLISVPFALAVGAFAEWSRAGWSRSIGRRIALGTVALAVVVVLASPFIRDVIDRTVAEYLAHGDPWEILADDPDVELVAPTQARVALYLGSLAVARDHLPFGAGLGRFGSFISGVNYSPVYAEYGLDRVPGLQEDRPVAIADAFWAMILGETGIFGLAAMAVFLFLILRGLWRTVGRARSPAAHAFTLGALLVFVEGLVGSVTASTFVAAPIALWVFAAAGVAESVGRVDAGLVYEPRKAFDASSRIRQASGTPSQPNTSTGRPSSSL
jgi:hypothetical protein